MVAPFDVETRGEKTIIRERSEIRIDLIIAIIHEHALTNQTFTIDQISTFLIIGNRQRRL